MVFLFSISTLAPFISFFLLYFLRFVFVLLLLFFTITILWSFLLFFLSFVFASWTLIFLFFTLNSILSTVWLIWRIFRSAILRRFIFWALLFFRTFLSISIPSLILSIASLWVILILVFWRFAILFLIILGVVVFGRLLFLAVWFLA